MIAVDGRKCWTLFDSGARNTYLIPSVGEVLKTSETPRTIRTALGGGVKEIVNDALRLLLREKRGPSLQNRER